MKTTVVLSPEFRINSNSIKPTKLKTVPFQKNEKYRANIAEKIWTPVKYFKLMGYLIASKHDKNHINTENIFYCKIFSLDSLWAISLQIILLCIYYKTSVK